MRLQPWWLLGLVAVAGLVAGSLLLRRRRRNLMLFTNLVLRQRLAPERPQWYRHVPVAVSLLALALLRVALTGPQAEAKVPRNRATVMLVTNVSLSMQSTDLAPTRLAVDHRCRDNPRSVLRPDSNCSCWRSERPPTSSAQRDAAGEGPGAWMAIPSLVISTRTRRRVSGWKSRGFRVGSSTVTSLLPGRKELS